MRPAERPPELTHLHFVVLGLVSTLEFGPPETLASEMGLDVEDVEALCRDLEQLGWIQRVGLQ